MGEKEAGTTGRNTYTCILAVQTWMRASERAHTRAAQGKAKSEQMNPSHADGPSASRGHGTHHKKREGAWPVVSESQISLCLDR